MRHENTIGLIGAKKTGGDGATGDLVVFFDCHVAPQKDWYKDFLNLIGENYRRMVIPDITALDIDTWTQVGAGGGMSKCYLTWDGDFKWGGACLKREVQKHRTHHKAFTSSLLFKPDNGFCDDNHLFSWLCSTNRLFFHMHKHRADGMHVGDMTQRFSLIVRHR